MRGDAAERAAIRGAAACLLSACVRAQCADAQTNKLQFRQFRHPATKEADAQLAGWANGAHRSTTPGKSCSLEGFQRLGSSSAKPSPA